MTDSPEERMDALLRDAARDYNAPPVTPKAELWERIEAARRSRRERETDAREGLALPIHPRWIRRPAFRLGLGVAALLTLGIAIGRISAPGRPAAGTTPPAAGLAATATARDSTSAAAPLRGTPSESAGEARRDRSDVAARLATVQYFGQVETFLTEFNAGRAAQDFTGQAHDLLSTTRLLLDSKRLSDVRTRQLLEDLELVLVQIATLDPQGRSDELEFISDGLARSHLRTRLRNAIPAGPTIRM